MYLPFENAINLTKFSFVRFSLKPQNHTNLFQILMRYNLENRILLYETHSLEPEPIILFLNPADPVYKDAEFNSNSVVDIIFAHLSVDELFEIKIDIEPAHFINPTFPFFVMFS